MEQRNGANINELYNRDGKVIVAVGSEGIFEHKPKDMSLDEYFDRAAARNTLFNDNAREAAKKHLREEYFGR